MKALVKSQDNPTVYSDEVLDKMLKEMQESNRETMETIKRTVVCSHLDEKSDESESESESKSKTLENPRDAMVEVSSYIESDYETKSTSTSGKSDCYIDTP